LKFYRKNKKIGLIGWWGGKNEGDRYILETLEKAFGDSFLLYPIEIPFDPKWTTRFQLNRLDFLVVGGGGLFTEAPPKPFDTFGKWGDRIKPPIGFLGVGVQEIKPEYQSIMKQIIERSKFFIVRDSGSFELVNHFSSRVMKVPDLTFLYPRYVSKKKASSTIGVNLRIWNFDERRTYDNSAWCCAINALPWKKETIPLSFLDGLKDADAMKDIEGERNTAFDIHIYERLRIMIGMRLHSLIFAAQNSIPVIGIAYTPKVRRFFQEVGLEEFCLGLGEHGRLGEVFNEAVKRSDEIEGILKRFTLDSNATIANMIKEVKSKMDNYTRNIRGV